MVYAEVMPKISSRSYETAEKIRDREPFETHGAFRAEKRETGNRFSVWDSGRLSGEDNEEWRRDLANIRYVVFSYATPIAWVYEDGTAYRVKQKFSVTTSKHQGKLYLLGDK